MKVIIAGSRGIKDYDLLKKAIKHSKFVITEVISGGAHGVDALGERWAKEHNIPCTVMKADWDRFGKAAGMYRNELMADKADGVIAVWDGESPGTAHMIHTAESRGLGLYVLTAKESKEGKDEKWQKPT